MPKAELKFKMIGDAFSREEGYDLFLLSKGLNNFNSLIEKSYLTITDKKRMTIQDRRLMKVKAFDIRPGSFVADLTISLLQTAPALLPIVTPQSSLALWSLVINGMDYLRAVLRENMKGSSFMTDVSNETGSVNVFNNNGDVIINNVHPDTFRYIKKAERNVESITRLIDPSLGFDGIAVSDQLNAKNQFMLGVEDKVLFEQKTQLDDEPITFLGELYHVDGDGFKGKVRVHEGADGVDVGEYNFDFLIKDRELLRKSFLQTRQIVALKETELNPATLKKRITRLRIIQTK